MEDHLDLRQRKTRKLLVEALAQLLVERPYQELSVVDICNRAMVHRTTFYAHFNDKQELLRYLPEGPELPCIRADRRGPGAPTPGSYLLTVAQNVLSFDAHRELYRAAISSGATDIQALEDLRRRNSFSPASPPMSSSRPRERLPPTSTPAASWLLSGGGWNVAPTSPKRLCFS